jgi:hypothetical protein
VRKVLFAVLALALACRPQQPAGPQSGASSARAAVDGILSALRAGDIQTVSTMWGTTRGPARDDNRFERAELERRIVLMTRCFNHDSYNVVGQVAGENGGQGFEVDLRRGRTTRRTRLNAVKGDKSERWYVDNLDIDSVKDFCQQARQPARSQPAPPR